MTQVQVAKVVLDQVRVWVKGTGQVCVLVTSKDADKDKPAVFRQCRTQEAAKATLGYVAKNIGKEAEKLEALMAKAVKGQTTAVGNFPAQEFQLKKGSWNWGFDQMQVEEIDL